MLLPNTMVDDDCTSANPSIIEGRLGPLGRFTTLVTLFCSGLMITACTTCQPDSETFADTPKIDDAELIKLAHTAKAEAIRLRQLPEMRPVGIKVASKDAILTYVTERLDTTDSQRLLKWTAVAFQLLGVLPDNYNMADELKLLLRDQVAGYYDWEKKTLFVADWLPSFLQRPTLVHEVVHALQDQHFDLGRFMEPQEGLSDIQSAIQALIEGDATLVMADDMLGIDANTEDAVSMRKRLLENLATQMQAAMQSVNAPPVIAESLLFPYAAGLKFVMYALEHHGPKTLDTLYHEPPLSTEAILHPEHWFSEPRDYPQSIGFTVPTEFNLHQCSAKITETAGEFLKGTLFAQGSPRDVATIAAAGWDGDTWMLFECGAEKRYVMAWVSVWDTHEDANEAAAALRTTPKPPLHVAVQESLVAGLWGERLGDPVGITQQLLSTVKLEPIESAPKRPGKKQPQ